MGRYQQREAHRLTLALAGEALEAARAGVLTPAAIRRIRAIEGQLLRLTEKIEE